MAQVQHLGLGEYPPADEAHVLLVRNRSTRVPDQIVVTMSGRAVHSHGAVPIPPQLLADDFDLALKMAQGYAARLHIPTI
jgi:hypothetical protein